MSISVIPVKWSPQWNQPHPHPCHYAICAHCFECMYCPIPTSFPFLKVSIPFRLSIDLQISSENVSTTSTSQLPHAVWPQHHLIKAFIFFPTSTLLPPSLPAQDPAWSVSLGKAEPVCAPSLTHMADWHSPICWTGWKGSDVSGGDDTNSLWALWVQWQLEWSVSIATALHCHLVDRGRRCTAWHDSTYSTVSQPYFASVSRVYLCLTPSCHFPFSSSLHRY